jgi:hypothetical protein
LRPISRGFGKRAVLRGARRASTMWRLPSRFATAPILSFGPTLTRCPSEQVVARSQWWSTDSKTVPAGLGFAARHGVCHPFF